MLESIVATGGEQIRVGSREIYVFYPNGMVQSRWKFPPAAGPVTMRNITAVTKLLAITASM